MCRDQAPVESLHESLAREVASFGITVIMIQPEAYATEFGKNATRAHPLDVYNAFRKDFMPGLISLERGNRRRLPKHCSR